MLRKHVSTPPRQAKDKLKWYGPGLLWMLSAVGTGSILFTPRVASQYRYQLLWLLILVVFFMWVMIREMARYSIATGETMLEGMQRLKGPKNWAVWVIFVPQLFAAAVGIAGLSAVVGSALAGALPGEGSTHAVAMILFCCAFTLTGNYFRLEKYSRYLAILLLLIVIVSAFAVFPAVDQVATGLWPQWPDNANLYIILPWVGTILAGSMGIIWFGYWTIQRGYGGGLESEDADDELPDEERQQLSQGATGDRHDKHVRIRQWIGVMTGTATLAVVCSLFVIFSFMVLGTELLAPKGLLPKGADVAVDLARLFSGIWGQAGKYLMLAAVAITLGGSVLANQDGWGRSFADITLILTRTVRHRASATWLKRLEALSPWPLFQRHILKRLYIGLVTGVAPILIVIIFKDPVQVMSLSGIIAAAHTPFIALAALIVNRTQLPETVRPGKFFTLMMTASGIFYLGFALIYLTRLLNAGA